MPLFLLRFFGKVVSIPLIRGRPGRREIAVKVVDIFGNDTMTIVDVTVKQEPRTE
ncbi:MAG: hypothetical protein ACREJB_03950 [Planctomycetaceae bacterium]